MSPVNGIGGVQGPGGTGYVAPVSPARPAGGGTPGAGNAPGGASFSEELQSAKGVQFSKHAAERVQRRGMTEDPQTVKRLENGVDLAASKGSRSAVVMVDDNAFVVAVPNRTVITALDKAHMRSQVFTNIDTAVIA
jgi:flagellar operon protein